MAKRAIIYLRVSSEGQRENTSFLWQFKRCRRWAEAHGYQVVGVVRECASASGGFEKKRPKFTEALQAIKDGTAEVLICYNMSRFARNASDALKVSEALKKHKRGLALVADNVDLSTPSGKLFFTMLAAFAEFELDMIRERTSSGKSARKAAGKYLGGPAPYGFTVENKELVTAAGEQLALDLIRSLRSEGVSARRTAIELNARGFQTREGKQWTHKQVSRRLALADRVAS